MQYNTSFMIGMIINCLLGCMVFSAGLADTPVRAQSEPNQVGVGIEATKADPNMLSVKKDPNTLLLYIYQYQPKFTKQTPSPVPGTLAMNWLYQGKEPPKPQIGNEKVVIEMDIRPWSYYENWLFCRPWLYNYDYWERYRNNVNPYSINRAAVRINLDTTMSFEFGGYTPYDLTGPYYKP